MWLESANIMWTKGVKDAYLNITALMYTQTKPVVLKLYGKVSHMDKSKKGSSQTQIFQSWDSFEVDLFSSCWCVKQISLVHILLNQLVFVHNCSPIISNILLHPLSPSFLSLCESQSLSCSGFGFVIPRVSDTDILSCSSVCHTDTEGIL